MSIAISPATLSPTIIPVMRDGKEVDLARSTVYIEFSLHALGDTRKVRATDMEVGEADKKLFHLSKRILESKTLENIHKFDRETRELIYLRCHPFKRSIYFLPLSLVEATERELHERKAERAILVSNFLDEYPDLCKQIATRLTKKYYNVADYPPVDAVAVRFEMSWQYISFGVPDALATVSAEIFTEARQHAVVQVKQAAEHIEALMRAKALELVAHLRDRLKTGADGKKQRLHESALTNLAEYLAYFDHKNVTRDDELKNVIDDLRSKLANTDVEAIKNTDTLRQRLCQEMSTITAHLESMVERVPKRQITLH